MRKLYVSIASVLLLLFGLTSMAQAAQGWQPLAEKFKKVKETRGRIRPFGWTTA